MKIKKKLMAIFLLVVSVGACGGGGGGASDGTTDADIPSLGGTYQGTLNRVSHKKDCATRQPTAYDAFAVTHNPGETALTIQMRSDVYSRNHPGIVTSPDSFTVEMEPKQAGLWRECTIQTTITFEDINESSARVRILEEHIGTKNCYSTFDKPSGSCTKIFEAVLART